MRLQWKEFMISLPLFEKYLKDTFGSKYIGYVTNESGYKIGLDSTATQADRDAIQARWDSITEESEEATKYMSLQEVRAKTQSIKSNAVSTPWDRMSELERKLLMQVPVDDLEIIEAEE